jgi:DNA-binding transcriptional regulator YdaS (Cro superfamily)
MSSLLTKIIPGCNIAIQIKESMRMAKTVLQKALESFVNQKVAAEVLGVSQTAVSNYMTGNKDRGPIPHKTVLKLCTVLDMKYRPEDIRPDEDWEWLDDYIKLYNKKRRK